MKPGSATFPVPGIDISILDESGTPVDKNVKGYLVVKKPWPGMLMTLWNDNGKYQNTYWNRFPGFYYAGDFALADTDNYIWLLGRSDDVLKVAGHRLGTMELESAFVSFIAVAEAAITSKPDEKKGDSIIAFLVLKSGYDGTDELRQDLTNYIRNTVGPIATPDEIHFVSRLPKTRSGKIMRRLLKSIASDIEIVGDISTIEDEASVEEVKQTYLELHKKSKSN
jgi:acetyl-CoA synthetase